MFIYSASNKLVVNNYAIIKATFCPLLHFVWQIGSISQKRKYFVAVHEVDVNDILGVILHNMNICKPFK